MPLTKKIKKTLGSVKPEKSNKFSVFAATAIGVLVISVGTFLLADSSARSQVTTDVSLSAIYSSDIESVKISWDKSKVTGQVSLQRKKDNESYLEIGPIPADKSTVYDSSIKGETIYYYRIKISSNELSTFSEPVEVNIPKLSAQVTPPAVSSADVPASPMNLVAQYISPSANASPYIRLTWKDGSTNETGFIIERSVVNTNSFVRVGLVKPNVTSFSDKITDKNLEYFYRLRAVNNNFSSGYSNIFVVGPTVFNHGVTPTSTPPVVTPTTTPTSTPPVVKPNAVPTAPAGLVLKYANRTVAVNWNDNSSNEDGFTVSRRVRDGLIWGQFVDIITLGGNINSFIDDRIDQKMVYQYRVKAFNEYGDSRFSNAAAIRIPVFSPTAPTGLSASYGNKQVTVSWVDASDTETGFVVERRGRDGLLWAPFVEVGRTEANQVTFVDSPQLVSLGLYNYRVKAFNEYGDSSYSKSFTLRLPSLVPAQPIDLTAAYANKQITVSWTDASDTENGFVIERRTRDGLLWTSFVEVGRVNANQTAFIDNPKLVSRGLYNYRIKAFNEYGDSKYSKSFTLRLPSLIPPQPTGLSASYGNKQVTVSWVDASDTETGFVVERRGRDGLLWAPFVEVGRTEANQVTFVDSPQLVSLGLYNYRVKAFNEYGDSSYSKSFTLRLPSLVPAQPAGLTAVYGNKQVNLAWTDNSTDESEFIIKRRIRILLIWGQFVEVGRTPANQTIFADSDISASSIYSYRIEAINEYGTSKPSPAVSIRLPAF